MVRPNSTGSGVIVHINHISLKGKTAKKSQLGELTSLVAGSLVDLVENEIGRAHV